MKYFNNPKTLEELKKQYKKLVMENHPDKGGDLEKMKAINVEVAALIAFFIGYDEAPFKCEQVSRNSN